MHDVTERSFLAKREAAELRAAENATSSVARRVHSDLAKLYRMAQDALPGTELKAS